ncbi:uncharacterized protein [Panulirus ornatus]|uniref:uncharacterized protein n=1 Tax=Panulirus ornatus TaxID=150431 RepID=UPI003A84EF16
MCRASVGHLLVLLLLATVGGVRPETLPTLTLQPLNYFTLPSPPASTPLPSSHPLTTTPSSPPSSVPFTSFTSKSPSGSPATTLEEGEEGEEEEGEEPETKQEVREPHFATPNSSLSVHLGSVATLDCTVHDPANQSVSWLRRVDDMLELLTWDSHTYANDHRYSLLQVSGDGWQQWQLVIRDAQVDDQGQYRCQLATEPPMVLAITLSVIVPRARVVDERGTGVLEKHYNSGSMIELMCVIEKVPFPHGPVTWRRGTTILTYNTSRGGISVKGDASSGYIRSRLYVADASPSDSGLYSCWYDNYTSDSVAVHVLAGENSAAMQHDALPDPSSETPTSPSCTSCLTCSSHLYLLLAATSFATWATTICQGFATWATTCQGFATWVVTTTTCRGFPTCLQSWVITVSLSWLATVFTTCRAFSLWLHRWLGTPVLPCFSRWFTQLAQRLERSSRRQVSR